MHRVKMINSRYIDNPICTKTITKNVQYAIEIALVHFNIITEEQVTKM